MYMRGLTFSKEDKFRMERSLLGWTNKIVVHVKKKKEYKSSHSVVTHFIKKHHFPIVFLLFLEWMAHY